MDETFETDRLTFELTDFNEEEWWAVDNDNIEYCVRPSMYVESMGLSEAGQWNATMQRRVGYDSVIEAIGTFDEFENACWACDESDPNTLGI